MRKNIREKLNTIINILNTQEILIALTQRYKSSQLSRFDFENKIQVNQNFTFNLRIDNCAKFNCCVEKTKNNFEQQNQSINNNWYNKIFKLFLRNANNSNNKSKNKRTCYNYNKKNISQKIVSNLNKTTLKSTL